MNEPVDAGDDVQPSEEQSASRRKFLMMGGAGAAAAVAATAAAVVAPERASAASGGNLILGQTNFAEGTTNLTFDNSSGTSGTVLTVYNAGTTVDAGVISTGNPGMRGNGNGTGAAGVIGTGDPGLSGAGPTALVAAGTSGTAPLAILTQNPAPLAIPPSTGSWSAGMVVAKGGHLYYCYSTGNGNTTSKWAKLSGGLVIFPAAKRAYDSRSSGGAISSGQTRTVSLAAGGVPAGASAALVNLTVTGTAGGGYLAVFAAGTAYQGTSNINWYASNQTIANNATTGLNSSAQVSVRCGGGSTQFIIDVAGYYP